MIWRSLVPIVLFVALAGCTSEPRFKPSKFAEDYDPGKVIESLGAVVFPDSTNTSPNRAVGMQVAYRHQSYSRIFHFEPKDKDSDTAALIAKFKASAESALRAEGFEVKYPEKLQPLPGDLTILYRSSKQDGTVHIFTTPTARGTIRVIGVIQEYSPRG